MREKNVYKLLNRNLGDMEFKISIIIPVYNVEQYIDKCVQSILKQDYTNWELILVNDGSRDNSGVICESYSNQFKNIHTIHKLNGGPSAARNIALEVVTGEYIMFVDSDDWIEYNTLTSIIDYSKQYGYPDILFWGYNKITNNSLQKCIPESLYSDDSITDIDCILSYLFTHVNAYFGFSVNKLFKTSIIKTNKISFKEDIMIKEDELFTLEYCNYIKSIAVIPLALYNYRISSYSLSHNSRTRVNYHRIAEYTDNLLSKCDYERLRNNIYYRLFDYYYNSILESYRYMDDSPLHKSRNLLKFYRRVPSVNKIAPKWFIYTFRLFKNPIDCYILTMATFLKNKFQK